MVSGLSGRPLATNLAIVERLEPLFIEHQEHSAINFVDQQLLAAEVIVDRRAVDLGIRRDVAERDRVDPVFREQPHRCLDHAVLGTAQWLLRPVVLGRSAR